MFKSSHIFNLLDAWVISVSERTGYINRIRDLAKGSGSLWLKNQENKCQNYLLNFLVKKYQLVYK